MAAKQRLTKGREKARQRKMHQIAKLLELPGSVGPSCPSPTPPINLHSLRQTSAAARRTRSKATTASQNQPSSSMSSRTQTPTHTKPFTAGSSRVSMPLQPPLFSVGGRIPGATAFASGRHPEQESNASSRVETDDEEDDNDNRYAFQTLSVGMKMCPP